MFIMSVCIVTGAAGFVGSHLSESLIEEGHRVIGIDCFVPYYPRPLKERNLTNLRASSSFEFHEMDLRECVPTQLLKQADVVFHLAAMAGLMLSWSDLPLYASCNIMGTKNLLEAAKEAAIPHFIQVSTSSVYGQNATGPESGLTQPCSPYGITKLAAENLTRAYESNFGLPITILRYFSVYGPRQRPDMAYNILIRALREGKPFPMFGDGTQTRSNTFVSDCVRATTLAFEQPSHSIGETFNVGGGEIVALNDVITLLEELTGKKARIERKEARPGDQKHTAANIEKAKTILGYHPTTTVREGLEAQVAWQLSQSVVQ